MRTLKELRRYPSAIVGLAIIFMFVIVSIYTVIAIPYSEGIRLWRAGPGVWENNSRRAAPVWFDYFTRDKMPRTIVLNLDEAAMTKELIGEGRERVEIVYDISYMYDGFPKEFTVFFNGSFEGGRASMSFYWWRPDGQMITLDEGRAIREASGRYPVSQDMNLRARLGAAPHVGLFARDLDVPAPEMKPLKGDYRLVIVGEMPVEDEFHEVKVVVYGQVEGLGGTDHLRRDLIVGLLWGAPIGLIFGIVAAVGAQVSTFIIAGIGTWFGGKVDAIFRRLTELNMILPFLVILIMIAHLYSVDIWTILGIVILLNVFSASYLTYRAMFLQAKELPYMEAAQAYGAGSFRMVFSYLLPRALPMLLPQFVMVIPTFVFLEASLAVLGLGDPQLATWGKIINDAQSNSAMYMGQYYWMVLPSILLMTIGLGFALVGFTLDRVFNPRLRTV
ncbi:MAG: ABC transporter permease [Dehalococcoidia bacterium]